MTQSKVLEPVHIINPQGCRHEKKKEKKIGTEKRDQSGITTNFFLYIMYTTRVL